MFAGDHTVGSRRSLPLEQNHRDSLSLCLKHSSLAWASSSFSKRVSGTARLMCRQATLLRSLTSSSDELRTLVRTLVSLGKDLEAFAACVWKG